MNGMAKLIPIITKVIIRPNVKGLFRNIAGLMNGAEVYRIRNKKNESNSTH